MSPKTAAELGLRALCNATDDKSTGGALRVFHVHKRGWDEVYNMKAMDVYLKYFNHMKFKDRQEQTLFLVCFQHIYADNLVADLSVAGVVESASCVARVGDFYFHRVVCGTSNVANLLLEYARVSQLTPPPLKNFPTGIYVGNRVPVYLQRCSEDLLNYLCEEKERLCNDIFEVHFNYHEIYYGCGIEAQTLFLVSCEKLHREDITSIKNLFSPPQGEAVIEAHWLGKRGNFNFYRFFFRTGSDALAAYDHVKRIKDVPPPLSIIPFKIGMLLQPSATPIYVELSSKALLEHICGLPAQARPMSYSHILKEPVNQ